MRLRNRDRHCHWMMSLIVCSAIGFNIVVIHNLCRWLAGMEDLRRPGIFVSVSAEMIGDAAELAGPSAKPPDPGTRRVAVLVRLFQHAVP